MAILIRPLTINDFQKVREIDIETQIQYLGDSFNQLTKEKQDNLLVTRQSEFSIYVDTGYSFVAENNGKVIGFLFAYETLPIKGTVYIQHIALKPDCQGQGIGVLLYNKLIETAKQAGIKKIWCLINSDNPNSIKLCEKVGFKLHDRKEGVLEI